MTRAKEADFVARHAFQRLSTTDLRADPTLVQAGVAAADVDNNGEIAGAPELSSLYRKLVALDVGATPAGGVDLDAPSVKPVYSALAVRFSQQVGVEVPLGTRSLAAVLELSAVLAGAATMVRKDGVRQLGMGSVHDALNVIAGAAERDGSGAGLDEEVPPVGTLKLVDRFTLPEVNPRFAAVLAEGRNPLLKDA
jgi:hypothetical protein